MSEYYRLSKDRYTTCIKCKDRKHQHYIYNNIVLCENCLKELDYAKKHKK